MSNRIRGLPARSPLCCRSSPVCDGIDWSLPLAELTRDEMISFLTNAYLLINKAIAARDKGEKMVTRKTPDGTTPPEAQEDWDDGIPERYA
jgi:hypothetical protein